MMGGSGGGFNAYNEGPSGNQDFVSINFETFKLFVSNISFFPCLPFLAFGYGIRYFCYCCSISFIWSLDQ